MRHPYQYTQFGLNSLVVPFYKSVLLRDCFLVAAPICLIPLLPCFSIIYSIPILVNADLFGSNSYYLISILVKFYFILLLRTHSILIIYSCAYSISFNLLLPCYYPIPLFHIATLSRFFWYNALSYFKFQLWIIVATTVSYYTYTLIVSAWLFCFHFQLLWIVASRCCLFYLENPSIDRCAVAVLFRSNRKAAAALQS